MIKSIRLHIRNINNKAMIETIVYMRNIKFSLFSFFNWLSDDSITFIVRTYCTWDNILYCFDKNGEYLIV